MTSTVHIPQQSSDEIVSWIDNMIDYGKEVCVAPFNPQAAISIGMMRSYSRLKLSERMFFLLTCSSIQGGYGDYFNLIKTAKIIKKHFVGCKMVLVAPDEESSQKLFRICDESLQKLIVTREWAEKNINHYTRHHVYSLDVACPDSQKCISYLSKDHLHIDEYNGWRISEALDKEPSTNTCSQWYSGGVGYTISSRFCTVGMHLTDDFERKHLKKWKHLQALQSPILRNTLVQHNTPQEYLLKTELYFGYNSTGDWQFHNRFIEILILLQSGSFIKNTDVVIVTPELFTVNDASRNFFLNAITTSLKRQISKHLGIYCIDNIKNEIIFKYNRSGYTRRFRLIWVNSLSHQDMISLLYASEPFTLTSGDQSLAEAICSEEKVFIYQIQGWKEDLIEQIHKIAKYMFTENSPLLLFMRLANRYYDYIKILKKADGFTEYERSDEEESSISTLSALLESPELYEQFIEFNQYIKKNYNIKDWLIGKIKRDVLIKKHPELLDYENKALIGSKRKRSKAVSKSISAIHEIVLKEQQSSKLRKY